MTRIEPEKVVLPDPPTVKVAVAENGQVTITTDTTEKATDGNE